MMRAIVYLRVSTDEQVESGAGLNAQRDLCRAWAAREGCAIEGTFEELEGVSGATPLDKRLALLDAINALAKGDILLVAKRDRIARDPLVIAMIEAAVARKRARVVSAAGEGTASDSPTDVLMRRIVDAFGEYERLLIRSRTKGALAAKRLRGERTGRIPYGSDVADDGRRSKRGNLPNALVANATEREVLDWMIRLRTQGWTYGRITWALNHRQIKTKAGKPWQISAVHHILSRLEIPPCPPPAREREPAPPPAASPSPTSSAN